MKLALLRNLLMLDAAILFLLGAVLILAPHFVELAFNFASLPPAVNYLLGLWGCLFATLAAGYVIAAANPLKHLVWVQIGIARGAIECLLGLVYLARGTVTFRQAGFGIIVAALISIAYIVLYPRKPRLIPPPASAAQPAATAPPP